MGLPWGSSPLARGAPFIGPREPGHEGIIPARAGSTDPEGWLFDYQWDHPRSRGEHSSQFVGVHPGQGSSPLARGARTPLEDLNKSERIIPARAGSTGGEVDVRLLVGDHPRSRGEHLKNAGLAGHPVGSSPLARGAPGLRPPEPGEQGIIPARAGSTGASPVSHWWSPDHPRSRGEHIFIASNPTMMTGSSPLARGAPDSLIPGPVLFEGSSPLARGARAGSKLTQQHRGIIPARAGSTGAAVPA